MITYVHVCMNHGYDTHILGCVYYVHHRKAWVKRQRIIYSYGQEDEDEQELDDIDVLRQEVEHSITDGSARPPVVPSTLPAIAGDVDMDIGGKGCPKCGSLTQTQQP